MIKSICEGKRLGLSYETICSSLGISSQVLRNWRRRGGLEASTGNYYLLVLEIKKAEAELEASALERIRKVAIGDNEKKTTKQVYRIENDQRILYEVVETVETALPNWLCDAFLLERLRPERYSKQSTTRFKSDGDLDEKISSNIDRLSKLFSIA